ncbi:Hypothetical predicted protein [Paramuricea clavata]|uniref:Uncharacterized protein n=1 Tax=Paramuricea clavata TaxID=317549 RepID=A0A7D9DVL7_PARCT|nr:Hypothetical predicted protein [Paramuricea clavata]
MTEVTKEALNEAKKKRRCAKSSVTRAGNGLDYLLKNERPIPEVEESLANLEDLYKKLVEKHDEYFSWWMAMKNLQLRKNGLKIVNRGLCR